MQKIQLSPAMFSQHSGGENNVHHLIDGDTATFWFPGWNAAFYPAKSTIDLGKPHNIHKIRVYDGSGAPVMQMWGALTLDAPRINILQKRLDKYNTWNEFDVDVSCRYIFLEINEPQGNSPIGELEIYGQEGQSSNTGNGTVEGAYSGDALKIGVNSFPWIPLNAYKPFACLREYLYWDWMEAEQGKNRFEPADGASANFDTHFAALKALGITTVACVNESPAWLTGAYNSLGNKREFKPIPLGESPLLPQSYRHFARFLFQLAARYGSRQHPINILSINTLSRWNGDPVNQPKSGLNLLQYIEVWNEPDKTWSGRDARFEPEEYAAMLSACYDGHEGRLGSGFGIKTADPAMKVVLGGLSNFDVPYMSRMVNWFKTNRSDKRFPADVANYHHYCNKTSWLNGSLTEAISPEADNIAQKLREVMAFNLAETPHCEVWYSEFGYDTDPSSPQHSKAYGGFSATDVQAIWNIRTYLESLAAGVHKCFIYNISDEKNPGGGLFQSSGVLWGEALQYGKKIAWDKILEFASTLSGYGFERDISVSADIRMYQFRAVDGSGKRLIVAWTSDSSGKTCVLKQGTQRIVLSNTPTFIELEIVS